MKKFIIFIFVVLTAKNSASTSQSYDAQSGPNYYPQTGGGTYQPSANYGEDSYSSYLQPQTMDTGYNVQPQSSGSGYNTPSSSSNYGQAASSNYNTQYTVDSATDYTKTGSYKPAYKPTQKVQQTQEDTAVNPGDECHSAEPNYYTTSCTPSGKSVSVCLNGKVLAVVQCPAETPYCDPDKLSCTKNLKKVLTDPKKPSYPAPDRKVPYKVKPVLKQVIRRPVMKQVVRRPAPSYPMRIENRVYYSRYPVRRQYAPVRRRNGAPTPKITCSNSLIKSKCTALGLATFNEVADLSLPKDRSKVSCMEPNPEKKLMVFDCPLEEFSCANVTAVSSMVPNCGLNECVQDWFKFSCIPKVYLRRRYRRDAEPVQQGLKDSFKGPVVIGGGIVGILPVDLPKVDTNRPSVDSSSKCGEFYKSCNFLSHTRIEENQLPYKGVLLSCLEPKAQHEATLFDCPSSAGSCVNIGQTLSTAPGCVLLECNHAYSKIFCSNSTKVEIKVSQPADPERNEIPLKEPTYSTCLSSEYRNKCKLLSHSSIEDNTLPVSGFLVQCREPTSSHAITLYDCPNSFSSCNNILQQWKLLPSCQFEECSSAGHIKFLCESSGDKMVGTKLKQVVMYYPEEDERPSFVDKEEMGAGMEIMEAIESGQVDASVEAVQI